MPETKLISVGADDAGLTVYLIVRQEATGYLLDAATGGFAASPANPHLTTIEDATRSGVYAASESRQVWADGEYSVAAYSQSGGAPAPASDDLIGYGQYSMLDDQEVTLASLSSAQGTLPADVASRLRQGVITNILSLTEGTPQTIIRGDVKTLQVDLGDTWDLTGLKAYMIAKAVPTAANSTAIVNRQMTVTDAVNGQCEITLTSAETATVGSYSAEIEIRAADDTLPRTAMQFDLEIIQDVRQ